MQHSIAIVDDHILIAKAISSIIEEHPDFHVLYEVANGKQLQEKFILKKNIPDIVLLDISMPIMNGFETARWLKENHTEVLVLSLSMQDDDASLIKMIRAGAKGYLLKNVEPKELIFALKELIDKGHYFPEWVASKMYQNLENDFKDEAKQPIKFNAREEEFLTYVCTELTYKEIGDQMFCSSRTIEGYRDAVCAKLDVKTRIGLVMYAIKKGYYKEG